MKIYLTNQGGNSSNAVHNKIQVSDKLLNIYTFTEIFLKFKDNLIEWKKQLFMQLKLNTRFVLSFGVFFCCLLWCFVVVFFFGGVFFVFCSMTARACSFMVEHPLMMPLVVLSAFLVVLSAF